MPDVANTLKDAAYVTVGLGVLGFQKAQVRRVELTKQLEEQRQQLESQLADATQALTDASAKLGQTATAQLDRLTQTLEAQIVELTKLLRTLAQDFDARVVPVRARLKENLDAFELRLPEQTRVLLQQARATAKETENQLRARLGLAAAA